jgi:hypothetical protein
MLRKETEADGLPHLKTSLFAHNVGFAQKSHNVAPDQRLNVQAEDYLCKLISTGRPSLCGRSNEFGSMRIGDDPP